MKLGATSLAVRKAAYLATMDDACQIGVRTETQNDIGELVNAPVYGAEVPCGLDVMAANAVRPRRFFDSQGTVYYADALIRLAADTAITSRDVVKVTKRRGVREPVPVVYELLNTPLVGLSGIVCHLRAVTA